MTHQHQPKPDSLSEMHEYRGVAKNRLALAMGITGAVMVLEVLGSVITGSLALGSDAGHMFTHLFALAISFVAITLACKKPCHHRTYGFYRVEILAALFNSIFLFAVTGYILFEGIVRLLNPQPVVGFEMLVVALFGLAANGLSILILRGSVKSDLNVRSAFLHMFADTASSVAIIFGAVIVTYTDWYLIDPLLGIGISVLIFVWAWGLFKDSVNVLLETAPKGMDSDDISATLKKQLPEITQISDMHIWEITSDMYSFTAHIQIAGLDYAKSKEVLERINRVLDEKYGIRHTTIQLEPTDN
ncbi:MAG: cation diffusion facilitator family transporter [Candidatus Bathyarchaeia archaeon]|jgi:cobalt-zinc-cadmium efflux system protein